LNNRDESEKDVRQIASIKKVSKWNSIAYVFCSRTQKRAEIKKTKLKIKDGSK